MVNLLPLKLLLWKGKEWSGVLLIKQHLTLVGGQGGSSSTCEKVFFF